MGDRALIIFKDANNVSPTVYLHWDGHAVPGLIQELRLLMGDRKNDASYAAARFIGIVHQQNPGNLSLGVFETPADVRAAARGGDQDSLAAYSHGDAGVVVVETSDFSWQAFAGYLADQ